MRPRVLHLVNWLVRGGIEIWLLRMLRAVDRAECQMDVCCKGRHVGDLAPLATAAGARVYHIRLVPPGFRFIAGLRRILAEGGYHVVHNHLQGLSGLPVWAARKLGIPVITSFHNTVIDSEVATHLPVAAPAINAYASLNVKYALRHSRLVTGCSLGVLRSLYAGSAIPGNARVLYYGVNPAPLATPEQRRTLREALGWPPVAPVILHVGRFAEQKSHLGLIAVFERVARDRPDARLLLVGDGPLRTVVEDAIARAGLNHSVRLLGHRDDVPALMAASDVFLFPSLYEGFGLVAIEANGAGLPVVGSDVPGLREAVEDGRTALLHDPADSVGMAASVLKFINDREYARQIGHAGRDRVEQNFGQEASARKLLDLYHECT